MSTTSPGAIEATVAGLTFDVLLPVDLDTVAEARRALERHTVDPDRWDLSGFDRGRITRLGAAGER